MMKDFYRNLLTKHGDLSKKFLTDTELSIRLVYDRNILEDYSIAHAFDAVTEGRKCFMLSNEEEGFKSTPVKLDFDFLCTRLDMFVKTNPFVVTDETHENFIVFKSFDDEYVWLVGKPKFLKQAQPYPLEVMKEFYVAWLEDDPSNPITKEFWEAWNEYEPFMMKQMKKSEKGS